MRDTLELLRMANIIRQREWDEGDIITLAYLGNAMAGEAGEACNVIKKLERERLGLKGSKSSKEALLQELPC